MTSENFKAVGKTNGFAQPAVLCLLLVAVTLIVYWPVTRCDFVNYDDPDYFSSNSHVQAGLTSDNVAWAFGTGRASNWHPLTWLSLMLDRELSGCGPAGPHFTNLLFHLANTVLLFLLLQRLDPGDVAERVRGRAVCLASVARGIGGMDFGAQGCFEHIFRAAGALDVCVLRATGDQ